ncbi:MAG UNVERIFIED_CONTAM: sulfatase-like hydrolase/transferase [Planctomycetaceae bacterium]
MLKHLRRRPPNVIFVLADDQGWGIRATTVIPAHALHISISSPLTDWSSKTSMPMAPSARRVAASFMTGQYPARLGFHHITSTLEVNRQRQVADWLDPEVRTVADVFRQAGYATAHFGKWHLGKYGDSPRPAAYGFDTAAVVSGPGDSLRHNRQEQADEDPFTMTRAAFDRAIAFAEEHADKPFYLHVWSPLPHALRPQPALREAFRDLNPDPQAFGKWMGDYIEAAKSPAEQMRTYLAAIAELDRNIGRLRAELTRLNIADNSILVFSSDNGPEDYHIGNASNAGMGSPGPLRGRKRSLYEGGIRVPFIATWPGRIPVGWVDETTIMSGVDLMPTLAALAGIPCNAPSIDGEDLSGALRGKPATRQRPLYWEWFFEVVGNPAWFAATARHAQRSWKFYCDYAGENVQLFDVASDPAESVRVILAATGCREPAPRIHACMVEISAFGQTTHRRRQWC